MSFILDFKGQSFDVVQQSVIDGAALPAENTRWKAILTDSTAPTLGTAHMGLLTANYPKLAPLVGDLVGGSIDLVLGTVLQGYEDSFDPRFTKRQRRERAVFSGLGGAVSGVAGGAIAIGIVCGPGAPVCAAVAGISGGLIGGATWSQGAQPALFNRFDRFQPKDNLMKYNN